MANSYVLAYEMNKEEIRRWHASVSACQRVVIKDDFQAVAEGLLYIVGEDGLSVEQLAMALDVSYAQAEAILQKIQAKYQQEKYGIELAAYGQAYKFVTKKLVLPYAQRLFNLSKPQALSQSALETLAIIAYKQPITRIEIEELRGVGAEVMLRKLQTRGLIREAGRSEAPGRPILYEVTKEFLDSFKLYTLDELPDLPAYDHDESLDLFE